jgi:DNA ligase-1
LKREFLLLAADWEPKKHDIGGWYMSEKLDGMRCFWDGGISRGLPKREVPYANNSAKDLRYTTEPIATGLWTRYGHPIQAPAWFLDQLPMGVNLDGELYLGRGRFQDVTSTCKQLVPDERWREVKFMIIDAPAWHQVLTDGELTGANWRGWLGYSMMEWVALRFATMGASPFAGFGLPDECFPRLWKLWPGPGVWKPMAQTKLPAHPDDAREVVDRALQDVTSQGGEGLVLRCPTGQWHPKRMQTCLKAKKLSDAEATVTGSTWGRKTALGSKHLGRVGALVVSFRGKRLELAGLEDAEREVEAIGDESFVNEDCGAGIVRTVPLESVKRQGKDMLGWRSKTFPVGTTITFTYRELTRDGLPKEARYLRRRTDV